MVLPVINGNEGAGQLARAMQQLVDHVRDMDERIKPSIEGWADNQTNVTTDRTFDANATSTAELADVVGTLIQDLIEVGIVR